MLSLFADDSNDLSHFKDEEMRFAAQFTRSQIGCFKESKSWDIRDALRLIAMRHLQGTLFNKNTLCKLPEMKEWKPSLLAFHLINEDFWGPMDPLLGTVAPATRKQIAHTMDSLWMMRTQPEDVLMKLRPIPTFEMDYCEEARACRMLSVAPLGWETGVDLIGTPFQSYRIQVCYCMRKWTITKRFSDFIQLQKEMYAEVDLLPNILRKDMMFKFQIGDKVARAKGLVLFVEKMHHSLAARGMYSPRLMAFLGVDVLRIHLEEEGRVAKILDSVNLNIGSVWHPVDEVWLRKWRKFVMGRGARRYMPPGKITNLRLMEEVPLTISTRSGVDVTYTKWMPKKGMVLGKDYRSLNYNMFAYLKCVHGGGPWISSKDKEIDDKLREMPLISKSEFGGVAGFRCVVGTGLEAIIRLQSFMRMAMCLIKKMKNHTDKLSHEAEGVREVLYRYKEKCIEDDTHAYIRKEEERRAMGYLEAASNFTQKTWRAKKQIAVGGKALEAIKEAQEIFAEASGTLEQPADASPLVVEDVENIVAIPSTEEYTVTFHEGMPFSVGLGEYAATGETVVTQLRDDGRDFVAKLGADKKETQKMPLIVMKSVLVAINDCPTKALSFQQVKDRVAKTPFPISLVLRKPLEETHQLHQLKVFEAEDIKLQAFKRLLVHGMPIKLHSKKKTPVKSTIWLTTTHLAWRTEDYSPDTDVAKFLKSCQLSHLVKKFKRWEGMHSGEAVTGVTRSMLEAANGKKYSGAVQDYTLTYEDIGCTVASECQKLFAETTAWGQADVLKDFHTRDAQNLFDIKFVREGKLSPGFQSKAKENHCFTVHLQAFDKKGNEVAKSRVLEFEVDLSEDDAEGKSAAELSALKMEMRDVVVWGLTRIVAEARSSKYFLGEDGRTHRRKAPVRRLRII
mmetsp:Transcript_34227/g.79068  ORF Transcript_34227/g.79068 Transcript_34227/m.79068 type:complete len:903 (-) Transcript_34227:177-2885(-)